MSFVVQEGLVTLSAADGLLVPWLTSPALVDLDSIVASSYGFIPIGMPTTINISGQQAVIQSAPNHDATTRVLLLSASLIATSKVAYYAVDRAS